jgi:serine/threonine protein kinase
MINVKGKVTMIDLGKAKCVQKERTFTVCGTTHSMPPEVYEGKGYSYGFDYYSFGVLVYELLVGAAPFGYEDFSSEYLEKIKKGLTEEHLEKIACPTTRVLIKRLMENDT